MCGGVEGHAKGVTTLTYALADIAVGEWKSWHAKEGVGIKPDPHIKTLTFLLTGR